MILFILYLFLYLGLGLGIVTLLETSKVYKTNSGVESAWIMCLYPIAVFAMIFYCILYGIVWVLSKIFK